MFVLTNKMNNHANETKSILKGHEKSLKSDGLALCLRVIDNQNQASFTEQL